LHKTAVDPVGNENLGQVGLGYHDWPTHKVVVLFHFIGRVIHEKQISVTNSRRY
jgi:hypothetical protein